jgi:hypothetical protein
MKSSLLLFVLEILNGEKGGKGLKLGYNDQNITFFLRYLLKSAISVTADHDVEGCR